MRTSRNAKAIKRHKTPLRMFSRQWVKKMSEAIDLIDEAIALAEQEYGKA